MMHPNSTHGHYGTATYRSWGSMLTRCRNPNREHFPRYGGRGIKVCKRWLKFENFLADMGERPKGKTLDRKHNDGDYTPSNCRWATPLEQRVNSSQLRLYSHNGKTQCLSHWCKEFAVKYETAIHRLLKGKTFEQAMAPKEPRKTHCLRGHPFSVANVYFSAEGYRQCIACRRISDRKRRPPGSRARKAKA